MSTDNSTDGKSDEDKEWAERINKSLEENASEEVSTPPALLEGLQPHPDQLIREDEGPMSDEEDDFAISPDDSDLERQATALEFVLGQALVDRDLSQEAVANDGKTKAPFDIIGKNFLQAQNDVAELTSLPDKELKEMADDPNSELRKLLKNLDSPENTKNALLALSSLTHAIEELKHNVVLSTDYLADKSSHGGKYKDNLSGNDAKLAFTASLTGVRKVFLHNSGFWLVLRPLRIAELNEFYQTVIHDSKELGRILGSEFYTIGDTYIKQKFFELLPLAVENSNLKGWRKTKTLLSNISIQDYDTLLWAFCLLMYPKGVYTDNKCNTEGCGGNQKDIHLDIEKMRLIDSSILTDEAKKFLLGNEERSASDLKSYREENLGLTASKVVDGVRFDLAVPSVQEVLDETNTVIQNIAALANGDMSITSEIVRTQQHLNLYRSYSPWIKYIHRLKEDGSVQFSTSDSSIYDVIYNHYLTNLDENGVSELSKVVTNFIETTKITHIGYRVSTCKLCKKSPSTAVDSYIPWDVQSLFFFLTCLNLTEAGLDVSLT